MKLYLNEKDMIDMEKFRVYDPSSPRESLRKALFEALKNGILNKAQLEISKIRTLSLVFSSERVHGFII